MKVGNGQCNGGVGGHGDHYCLLGGACNEGGEPNGNPTIAGVSCPGEAEYLLCVEDTTIDLQACEEACAADDSCVGFLLSSNLAGNADHVGASRCELHVKEITSVSDPLECYTYSAQTFQKLGNGPCRTVEETMHGNQAGTFYGNMSVAWVSDLMECEAACEADGRCVGVEWHSTPTQHGNKCEIHYEALGTNQMVEFQCWEKNKTATVAGAMGLKHTSSLLPIAALTLAAVSAAA